MNPARAYGILYDVFLERTRQANKWGEQHHAATMPTDQRVNFWTAMADQAKISNDNDVENFGDAGWQGILLEEVYEALAETDPADVAKLRVELIQVAAVAAAWVEDLDRG